MTKIDTSTEAVEALLKAVTPGRPVQFHPKYCPEAKGAQPKDWDTSHDLSVILPDGSRYRIGTFRHADDALFDQVARELVPALLAKLAKAVDALEYYAVEALPWEADDSLRARTTLAEIKGESHE